MRPVGITVNGTEHTVAEGVSVRQLLSDLGLPSTGVALAVDGAVLPKSRWDDPVERGWEIEVLTAVQGG